jgi:hypothetical protein
MADKDAALQRLRKDKLDLQEQNKQLRETLKDPEHMDVFVRPPHRDTGDKQNSGRRIVAPIPNKVQVSQEELHRLRSAKDRLEGKVAKLERDAATAKQAFEEAVVERNRDADAARQQLDQLQDQRDDRERQGAIDRDRAISAETMVKETRVEISILRSEVSYLSNLAVKLCGRADIILWLPEARKVKE